MRKPIILFSFLIALTVILTSSVYAEEGIYKSVSTEKKQIALTFDDGPHPGRTPEILDILAQYNIKATFFVVGENAVAYSEIIERELEEGHEIGNHTYTHQILKNSTKKMLDDEVRRVEESLYEICEYRPKLIRPPGGLYNDTFTKYALQNDYDIILWSIDTVDWSHPSVDKIVKNVLCNVKNGSIILMHDYIAGRSPTPEALKKILPKLIDEGYEFVTVTELLQCNSRDE